MEVELLGEREPRLWRLHSDAVNCAFIRRAVAGRRFDRALKTDLFDEAITDGIVPVLRESAQSVNGIDLSEEITERARRRYPDLGVEIADVRSLPFEEGAFDLVVSTSTIDHLGSLNEIAGAIRELRRVLAPGGILALTVDNQENPVVALRGLLPEAPMRRLGLVAYSVGATVGPRRLERLVREPGLRSHRQEALMHCPRVLAVFLARRIEGSPRARARFLRGAARFESLAKLPSRYLTGHFAAIVAER